MIALPLCLPLQYMIDMENLFDLLERQSAVQDKPGAKDLVIASGEGGREGGGREEGLGADIRLMLVQVHG